MNSDIDKAITTFRYFAKNYKLNNTKERDNIIQAICSIHSHFDIKDLVKLLKERNVNIAKSTIYRTINLFVKINMLKRLKIDDSYRYEHALDYAHHDHLICISCNKIIEFVDNVIEERQSMICKKYNFIETDHSLQIFGFCSECSKNKENMPLKG